ncbi:hypothetical protein [Streptomyces cucumeris]|uniref:hypothetical protein n=1 Tax=Streptomyces cucumeris TaxID=2962890 RepID=UPI0020C91265|nr:hypothetical protein [Streptomyces sp. NEAU-Y11]MCP9209962.1 hypothetical protein [Streptomyces sp. NEAU-Y11]
MRVKPVDGRRAAGARLLAVVMQHAELAALPPGVWTSEASEGRLMDADGGVWFIEDGGRAVQRLRFLLCRCGCAELTTYRDGRELSREVGGPR